jgi:hypothetical protein
MESRSLGLRPRCTDIVGNMALEAWRIIGVNFVIVLGHDFRYMNERARVCSVPLSVSLLLGDSAP